LSEKGKSELVTVHAQRRQTKTGNQFDALRTKMFFRKNIFLL